MSEGEDTTRYVPPVEDVKVNIVDAALKIADSWAASQTRPGNPGWGNEVDGLIVLAAAYRSLQAHLAEQRKELEAEKKRGDGLEKEMWAAREDRNGWKQGQVNLAKACREHCERANKAEAQLSEARKECEEQARLNGMGSEREARLMAQLSKARAEVEAVKGLANLARGQEAMAHREWDKLQAENSRLAESVEAERGATNACLEKLDRLTAENEALRKALEEIAGLSKPYHLSGMMLADALNGLVNKTKEIADAVLPKPPACPGCGHGRDGIHGYWCKASPSTQPTEEV